MMTKKYEIVGTAEIYEGYIAEGNLCDYLELEDLCDLLNELHDQNKELKKEKEQLKKEIGNLEHTKDFCAECCERLEKENDELKSKIRKVEREYTQLWMHTYK